MPTEYDDELGYDADHEDPSQYCRHGTWIGSWWGPDYMCQWCESGTEPLSYAEVIEVWRGTLEAGAARYDEMVAAVAATITRADVALDHRASLRQLLVNSADAFRDAVLAWERLAEVEAEQQQRPRWNAQLERMALRGVG